MLFTLTAIATATSTITNKTTNFIIKLLFDFRCNAKLSGQLKNRTILYLDLDSKTRI